MGQGSRWTPIASALGSVAAMGMLLVALSSSHGSMLEAAKGADRGRLVAHVAARRELPAPVREQAICQGPYGLCLQTLTGTIRSTFVITKPGGVTGFGEYQLANFQQRLLSRSSDAIRIEVTSRPYVDTRAPYPVVASALPESVRASLQPVPGWIQSDDPLIVAKATELSAGATKEAEVIDAIVAWVRGNITYDYTFSLPNDASAVFRNRSGVCAGFSAVTTALLRAAGVPAQYDVGCVARFGWDGISWGVGDAGGWHAWVEAYYTDVGWIASDPQASSNFLDTSHILAGFDQCGAAGTVIARTAHEEPVEYLYNLRTPYAGAAWWSLHVATVPAWDRHPLRTQPVSPSVMLPADQPVGELRLWVENRGCETEDWQVVANAAWLGTTVVTGTTAGWATLGVDASGLSLGSYSTPLTVYGSVSPWAPGWAVSRTVTARLLLVEDVHDVYLPLVSRP